MSKCSLRSGWVLNLVLLAACGGGEKGGAMPPVSGNFGGSAAPGAPANGGGNPGSVAPTGNSSSTPAANGSTGSNEGPVVNGGTPLMPGSDPNAEPNNSGSSLVPPFEPGPPNSGVVGGTPNLFTDVLGRTQAEVDTKLRTAVDRFFGIGSGDPATPSVGNGGARSFYVLPQDSSMGFVWAADSADIRSEGMSYGMFIAVQMNMQEQFDQLWRFAKTYMQYPSEPEADLVGWRLYFRWTGKVDTGDAGNWQVNYNATESPASDGEEYFAAALYLADRRWGSAGALNYQADADALTHAMLHNPESAGRTPLIDAESNMVTFVPYGTSAEHSDPSYHLPAFYELFAQDGPQVNSERWRQVAEVSRGYFVSSANASTGLHPDYAKFDGTPTQGYQASNHDSFRFDAWRVPLNMAVDYAWSGPDPRLRTQMDKYLQFFSSRLANGNVTASGFSLDGSNGSGGGSQALVATLATATNGSNEASRMTFLDNLWNIQQPTGQYRYYQGAVYLLGLLAASGSLDYGWPQ
jgi:oligosaccharide reducing-end xylanase